MSARIEYERHEREAADLAVEIRQKLFDTYMELADQAGTRRQWEAASAFQYAAQLALGMVVQVKVIDRQPKVKVMSFNDVLCNSGLSDGTSGDG